MTHGQYSTHNTIQHSSGGSYGGPQYPKNGVIGTHAPQNHGNSTANSGPRNTKLSNYDQNATVLNPTHIYNSVAGNNN